MFRTLTRGRVNPLVPLVAIAAGLIVVGTGRSWIGAGVGIGGILAYLNGLILWRRVDLAAESGNAAAALLVMQAGLLVTMTVIGLTSVVLMLLSPPMAIAAAIAFAATWLAILTVFYLAHGRQPASTEVRAR